MSDATTYTNASILEKTKLTWESLHKLHDCVILPEQFQQERDRYDSDEAAFATIKANMLSNVLEDGQYLIEIYLIQGSKEANWQEQLPNVLEQLIQYPEAIEAITYGLQSILKYGPEYGTEPEDFHQFKELVYAKYPTLRLGEFRNPAGSITAGSEDRAAA